MPVSTAAFEAGTKTQIIGAQSEDPDGMLRYLAGDFDCLVMEMLTPPSDHIPLGRRRCFETERRRIYFDEIASATADLRRTMQQEFLFTASY